MSKALLNAAQVAGLIGQRRRAYSPDRTEWMDYVVLRPAYGGRVWVRYDHNPTSEMTVPISDVLRDEPVDLSQCEAAHELPGEPVSIRRTTR